MKNYTLMGYSLLFRISNLLYKQLLFFLFRILQIALCYPHISFTEQNILEDYDVIRVDYLRCANKECECSYQKLKNLIWMAYFLIKMIFFSKFEGRRYLASIPEYKGKGYIFIPQNQFLH